jgi:hypothetical protein
MNGLIQQILQLIIVTVLVFVLLYGIGFILNMLLKTTWFPIYVYIIVLIPLVVYWQWDTSGTLWSNLTGYAVVDYVTAIGGLAGAYLSGVSLKTLRDRGYQMF